MVRLRAWCLNAEGLFRVWSTDLEEIPHSGVRMFRGDYPLTEEAEARRAVWDAGDSSLLECTEWNMPYIMYNPLPMEFLRQGDDILLRFEEDDNERLIHMNAGKNSGSMQLLGTDLGPVLDAVPVDRAHHAFTGPQPTGDGGVLPIGDADFDLP